VVGNESARRCHEVIANRYRILSIVQRTRCAGRSLTAIWYKCIILMSYMTRVTRKKRVSPQMDGNVTVSAVNKKYWVDGKNKWISLAVVSIRRFGQKRTNRTMTGAVLVQTDLSSRLTLRLSQ